MRNQQKIKNQLEFRRVKRVRAKIKGSAEKPRLAIFKSLKHISIQAIDDLSGKTLAASSDREVSAKGAASGGKAKDSKEKAKLIGELIAKKLLEKKISQAVFDKRHYKYHGLIKIAADSAREAGLKF